MVATRPCADGLDIAPFRRVVGHVPEVRIERQDQRRLAVDDRLQADPLHADMVGLRALVDIFAARQPHRLDMKGIGAFGREAVRPFGVIIAQPFFRRHGGDGLFDPRQRRGNGGGQFRRAFAPVEQVAQEFQRLGIIRDRIEPDIGERKPRAPVMPLGVAMFAHRLQPGDDQVGALRQNFLGIRPRAVAGHAAKRRQFGDLRRKEGAFAGRWAAY